MYELPPFEDTFQPMKHNKYLMRRNDVVSRFVTRHTPPCDKSQHVTCAGTAPARDITSRPPTRWPRQTRPGSWRRGWGRPSPGAGPSTRAASSVRTLRHLRNFLRDYLYVMSGLLVSPFFLVIIITELLYSYAVDIDERAVPFEATPP